MIKKINNSKLKYFILISFLLISTLIFIKNFKIFQAQALPVLNVSISAGSRPLLGGTATYTIRVENTGDERGYNLTIENLFSSSRTEPEGTISLVSVDSSMGPLNPNELFTDGATGDTTLNFINIRDLEPTEVFTLTLEVDTSEDTSWQVYDDLILNSNASVNTLLDGTGSDITGNANATESILPIQIVNKSANQSSGVEQVTGTTTETYSYTIEIQNNYAQNSDNVVITDTLPDGVEFLGVTTGPALDGGFPLRDNATGETVLQWTLGAMSASSNQVITYDAGIRYDYFGTNNGGTNRIHDDFSGAPASLGTPIPNKNSLQNTAELAADYTDTGVCTSTCAVTDSNSASVTAAYSTVEKSVDLNTVGIGTIVTYTINYHASEYYNTLDSGSNPITITDELSDGQVYNSDASVTPTNIVNNPDGSTTLVWDETALGLLTQSSSQTITFSATIDNSWSDPDPPYNNNDVVAGDNLANQVSFFGQWEDQIDTARAGAVSNSDNSTSIGTALPEINKQIEDPDNPGTWIDATTATVGDTLTFRLRFNTNDGATPIRNDISMKDVYLTDWLPKGFSYNNDSVINYSDSGHFTDPSGDPPALNYNGTPHNVTIGGLEGLEWYLGDVTQNGWWEAIFTVTVDHDSSMADGKLVTNMFKMGGNNTLGEHYSDRDDSTIELQLPQIVTNKTATSIPSPLLPGDTVTYEMTFENTGSVEAKDILITDDLPQGMRNNSPTITSIDLSGTGLIEDTDYKFNPVYDSVSGIWSIDLNDTSAPAVETNINNGEILTITYEATVDPDIGAGAELTNLATAAYNTQANGSGYFTAGTSDPADLNTDNETVNIAPVNIAKSSNAGPFTIGDSITYQIEVTVPRGTYVYWPELVDVMDRDGLVYQTGSTALSLVSGTPVTPISFEATTNPDPTLTTAGDDNTQLNWLFNNYIDNSGQVSDYVFNLSYDVIYNGLEDNNSFEFDPPQTNDTLNNDANFNYNSLNEASRSTNQTASGNDSNSLIQPVLETNKTIVTTPPYYPQTIVTYQVTLENIGQSTAYEVYFDDDISPFTHSPTLISVTHSNLGNLSSGSDFLENFTGDPIIIDFDGGSSETNLAPGEIITIEYTATINDDIGAGADIRNTADADWSSQDGSVSEERVYNDSSNEAYTDDTNSTTINIEEAVLTKSIDNPSSAEATIGDIIDYRLTVQVPTETVMHSTYIEDIITKDGLSYINGSASLSYVSGDPETPANLTNINFDANNPNPGNTLTFTLNDIDNADPAVTIGDTNYIFEISYQMRVTGLNDASSWVFDPAFLNETVINQANLNWNDTAPGTANQTTNDTQTLAINQPHLTTSKNFNGSGPTINATVVIENTGDATAYELDSGLDFIDTVPDGFTNTTLTSVTHSTNGLLEDPTDYSTAINGNDLEIEFNNSNFNLNPGETLTVEYTLETEPSVGAGISLTNSADINWSNQSDDDPDERNYNDTDPLEGNADTDSDNYTTPLASISKTSNAPGAEATIGEQFSYTVTVDIPTNTTLYNAVLTDTVPDGLTVIGTNSNPTLGSISIGSQVNGATPVSWNIGDPSDPTIDVLELTITVEVDDAYFDETLLDGLPSSIDGNSRDTLNNQALIEWEDQTSGGSSHNQNTNYLITVQEPNLTITKIIDSSSGSAPDTVTYTVLLSNNGSSEAYDIILSDTMPEELFEAGSSPTLNSIEHSLNGTLIENNDFQINLNANPVLIDFNGNVNHTNLPPGETLTIEYEAQIESSVSDGDILNNQAEITRYRTQEGGGRTKTTGPVDTLLNIFGPELNINIDDNNHITTAGDNYIYTVDYANNGGGADSGVEILITVPEHVGFDPSSSDSGWSCSPNNNAGSLCSYSIGNLASGGAGGSLAFGVTVDNPVISGVNQIEITAEITDDGASGVDPNLANNSDSDFTPLDAYPDLQITKTDNQTQVYQADTLYYTLNYSNLGGQNATGVVITETVPENTIFDPDINDENWNCTPDIYAGSTCTYNLSNLAGNGNSGSLEFNLAVIDPVTNYEITNTVEIEDDESNGTETDLTNNSSTETTPILLDPPYGVKTVSGDGQPYLTWRIYWVNPGNNTALGVSVNDPIPENTTYIPDTLNCVALGDSTQESCFYDKENNQIVFVGDIAPDFDLIDEDDAQNEIIITFQTETYPGHYSEVENRAIAYWDENQDDLIDESDINFKETTPITTGLPTTFPSVEPKGSSSIGNYIWYDKDGDGDQDEDEEGLEDIRVKIIWAGPDNEFGTPDDYIFRTETDDDGRYLFEDLPAGRYRIKVKKEDVEKYSQTYDPDDNKNHKTSINLRENQNYTKGDFGYIEEDELEVIKAKELAKTGKNLVLPIFLSIILALFAIGFILYGLNPHLDLIKIRGKLPLSQKSNKILIIIGSSILTITIIIYLPLFLNEIGWKLNQQKIETQTKSILKDPQKLKEIEDNRIIIPKIGLNALIQENIDEAKIKDGIWRRPHTSTPKKGGNTVITGHNFQYLNNGENNFYRLDKLNNKDNIFIYWENKKYQYQILETKVVAPTQTEIENNTKEDILTLYTCTPLLTAKNRLVVKAKLVK
jgi:LPXTG-site transpeptidase (sortase) family protein